jgi:c-di-GMP-binding flagellar brake protein YcgR
MPTKPADTGSLAQQQSDRRRHSRYALVAPIAVQTATSGPVMGSRGMTVEISEGGVSAYLREEFETGQTVKLQLNLSAGGLEVSAIVRNRLGRRYGFQFLKLLPEQRQKIHQSCRGVPPYRSSLPTE